MDKEFGYRSEKSAPNTNSPISNATALGALGPGGGGSSASLKDKAPFSIGTSPFVVDVSNSTPVRNYENSTELNGTYRSRNNNGYDNSADESSINRVHMGSGGGGGRDLTPPPPLPPLNRQISSPSGKSRPRVDHDEYWRTNI